MSQKRKLKDKLGEYLDLYKIDAQKMHIDTGIALSTCYKIKRREVTVGLVNLGKIVKAYPKFSATYLLTEC